VHSDDWKNYEPSLRQAIQLALRAWDDFEVRVFCPIAIGEHVDHIMVRSAVEGVCELQKLIYYEDFPYVVRPDAIQPQVIVNNSDEKWRSITFELAVSEIDARIRAAACYVSQIPILFPSPRQHLQNRIMFHFPFLGRYLNGSTDMNSSRLRLSLPLKAYIAHIGGERYWFRGTEPALELEQDEGILRTVKL
jgi:LmbE family N-acetylglucosaminyl deacetylase